jgi:hypothetical protein
MRRTTRAATAGVAAATLGLGLALPATAAPSVTYHGYYDGMTTYKADGQSTNCPATQLEVDGTWNVRISADGTKATMSTNLFYDGVHHLAYGGGFAVESVGEHTFTITGQGVGEDGAPLTITLELRADGELVYTVAPYHLYGKDCASLTLTGQEGRPAA